jgi:HD-GYP domain-containing protein (c-di-GMP phosphodiesterase class II)
MGQDELLLDRLRRLHEIGVALSAERNLPVLLGRIVDAALEMTDADGCTLYLVRDGFLHFGIVRNLSLSLRLGSVDGGDLALAPIPLRHLDGSPNLNAVSAAAANQRRTILLDDAYTNQEFDFSGARAFDQANGYRSKSFLTMPLIDHEDELLGVLQLVNSIDPGSGDIVPFNNDSRFLAESLASQAAVVLNNRELIDRLEALFVAFIKVINDALDEKSPYTHGHCERVPVLTMMLAEAAARTESGPLREFVLTDAMRRELELAALLHDCGKITTPVHVVDKSTKLETIFDRIHLVDTRYEVLKRDARIRLLEERLAQVDPDWRSGIDARYGERCTALDVERDFLRQANIGGEAMSDQEIGQIEAIARSQRWHGPDGMERPLLDAEETAKLSIRKGTLSQDERQVINRHIESTIHMLGVLPWPRDLRNVPEYAGGHHERMDGKGYPRGLTGDQMSIPARIMAIADVFEALTANDRPYKGAKKLSEALRILGRMKLDRHIDPDLFDVFVREKVYLDYARRYLDAGLIDEPDKNGMPGYNPAHDQTEPV